MTELERIRIRATLDALIRAANAPTTDEEFKWNQEAQRIWNAPPKPKVVTLCGSTRFYDEFQEANFRLTMDGVIVLSVGFYPHTKSAHEYLEHGEHVGITENQKEALDELHKRKIDLSDEIFVLNVGGYIGESTRSEIAYAEKTGKTVRFLEPAP